jgi:hypothetical protein
VAVVLLIGALLGVHVRPAYADRIDDLAKTLESDDDDKARIAAAVALGRIGDAKAVPALIRALKDKSPVVRGMAASALGRIGDERAIPALEKLLGDPSDAVRDRARDALALIKEKHARKSGGGRVIDQDQQYVTPKESPRMDANLPGPRMYVVVKSAANKTESGGAGLGVKLKEYLVAELNSSPEVTLDSEIAGKDKLTGFIIDGAIVEMTKTSGVKWIEMKVEVRISISNQKGRMLSIVTGKATLSVPKSSWKDKEEKKLWLTALENAVRGANQNLIGYMTQQCP